MTVKSDMKLNFSWPNGIKLLHELSMKNAKWLSSFELVNSPRPNQQTGIFNVKEMKRSHKLMIQHKSADETTELAFLGDVEYSSKAQKVYGKFTHKSPADGRGLPWEVNFTNSIEKDNLFQLNTHLEIKRDNNLFLFGHNLKELPDSSSLSSYTIRTFVQVINVSIPSNEPRGYRIFNQLQIKSRNDGKLKQYYLIKSLRYFPNGDLSGEGQGLYAARIVFQPSLISSTVHLELQKKPTQDLLFTDNIRLEPDRDQCENAYRLHVERSLFFAKDERLVEGKVGFVYSFTFGLNNTATIMGTSAQH